MYRTSLLAPLNVEEHGEEVSEISNQIIEFYEEPFEEPRKPEKEEKKKPKKEPKEKPEKQLSDKETKALIKKLEKEIDAKFPSLKGYKKPKKTIKELETILSFKTLKEANKYLKSLKETPAAIPIDGSGTGTPAMLP